MLVLNQGLLVIAGNTQICLGEDHFQHIHVGAEERPALHHLPQLGQAVRLGRLFEGNITAQPAGQHQPHLGPGKNPRNGSQAFNAPCGLAPGRPAAKGKFTQSRFRCDLAEVRHKIRILTDHLTVGPQRTLGQPVHHLAPLILWHRWWRQGRLNHRGGVQGQTLHRQPRQTKFKADHLALLGNPEAAVHRARRLGQNRPIRRTTAPAYGAAAAMKQSQMHSIPIGHFGQLLLGLVLGPGRHQLAGILRGV